MDDDRRATVRVTCNGNGAVICRCGGDTCICGIDVMLCPGCPECEDRDEDEGYDPRACFDGDDDE